MTDYSRKFQKQMWMLKFLTVCWCISMGYLLIVFLLTK